MKLYRRFNLIQWLAQKIHTLSVDSSTKHLSEVRDFVAAYAQKFGLTEKEISEIRLAVDEAYTNIIKHAYKNSPSNPVKIEVGTDSKNMDIYFRRRRKL